MYSDGGTKKGLRRVKEALEGGELGHEGLSEGRFEGEFKEVEKYVF